MRGSVTVKYPGNDEIKKHLFVGYYSEKEIELTIMLNNKETIEIQKIELLNDTFVMVKMRNEESQLIPLKEISRIL